MAERGSPRTAPRNAGYGFRGVVAVLQRIRFKICSCLFTKSAFPILLASSFEFLIHPFWRDSSNSFPSLLIYSPQSSCDGFHHHSLLSDTTSFICCCCAVAEAAAVASPHPSFCPSSSPATRPHPNPPVRVVTCIFPPRAKWMRRGEWCDVAG